jgi:predicted transcriptional regulator of viral defense system
MNKVELLKKFKEFKKPFYTFGDIQLVLGLEKMSANKRIIDLVKQGFLVKLGRNIFVPSFWEYNILDIASQLHTFTYISFESALIWYNIIEEDQNILTLASLYQISSRNLGNKTVNWTKLKDELFFGFELKENKMIATPEKAFADILYLVAFGKIEFDGLKSIIDKLDIKKLNEYLERYPKRVISALDQI